MISGILFCVTHALLSSLMFFLVDCVQRRYKSRLISEISGLISITPKIGIMIFCMILLFSGLPGSVKFISEVLLFSGLIESAPITFIIVIVSGNIIGLISFSKI
jgi:NADH-quinone oxidoreductase subunit M